MKEKVKTIYYTNELTDEFSTAQITPKYIDGKYEYLHNTPTGKIGHFFWYRMLVRPFGQAYMKLKFGHRIVNRHLWKERKGQGVFLFGNHTNAIPDAFIPSAIGFPTDAYVIVHPNNVSMPVLGKITPFLGALPLPDDMAAAKNFMKAVKQVIVDGKYVVIYPEAHIWPYYTHIRPFTDASFGYPISCKADIYCFTNTYQKRRFCKTPRMVTYLDGPYTAPPDIPLKEQKKILRDQVYETMRNRSKNNNVEIIQYCKAEDK
ncbi:MAG TPA: 1-acyl-sn-glycerol-3-phosphate acyltransferase [Lachnospiraceae bacterium]|nr:1-acyl-sn-glycerol-3-phosphate acyltransferase [Lachnospiraceae bacterium]